jgi:uncharacterized protein
MMRMTWASRLERSGGQLLSHAVRFSRQLREAGVVVSPAQTATFTEALSLIDLLEPGAFRDAARCTLVNRREDVARFEATFARFWRDLGLGGIPDELLSQARLPPPKKPTARPGEVRDAGRAAPRDAPSSPQLVTDRAFTFSTDEVLKTKRFDGMNASELEAVKRALEKFRWRISERRTRRLRHDARGSRLDVRGTVRRALRSQGEFVRLERRERGARPRDLIVLCDVSGSMERFARLLLHFVHTLTQRKASSRRVESFAFGTRLTRITKALERRSVDEALTEVGRSVNDWSGGTRIGSSLDAFNRGWGKRVLGRGAVVLLISDGWDRGEPALLTAAMERLQKTCHRLVWLNPLVGTTGFTPQTRGLLAALPFVDDFLGVQNLRSLEELAVHLSRLDSRRGRTRRSGSVSGLT